jgi:ribosomal protein S18 acetylase RimI-like enzyme
LVSPGIYIKRAGKDDAGVLSDLSNITFIETYRGSCPDNDLLTVMDNWFNEEAIAKELDDPDDLYYIAFSEGFPAGYMRLKEEDAEYPLEKKYKAIQLKRIYVLKEYQSKKIGAALMSFALQLAAEKNYELLWLGVWEGNEKARSFYDKWGFTDINYPYKFYVGNTIHTDRWMTRLIERT